MILSAADGAQHFADGLHGLGQILHDLHIQIPPDVGVLFIENYRLPMQAASSPMDCMVFMIFFFIVILVTSKVERELCSISRRSCSAARRKQTWTQPDS